jgi:hypothetical protein
MYFDTLLKIAAKVGGESNYTRFIKKVFFDAAV